MTSRTKPQSAFFPSEEEKEPRSGGRGLSIDDVTNQGRYLLNNFIRERIERDNIANAPDIQELQEPDTPLGPPMVHHREIARALRCIGDELDRDQKLQEMIKKVPPDSERTTFLNVVNTIFADKIFNWGRVVALFYFAYKICAQIVDRIPLVRAIINIILDFLRDHVARWILERGGWEAIREYFGSTWKQFAVVSGAGALVLAAIYFKRILY